MSPLSADVRLRVAGDMTTLPSPVLAETNDDESGEEEGAAAALSPAWASAASCRRALAGACSIRAPRTWAQKSGQQASAPTPGGFVPTTTTQVLG